MGGGLGVDGGRVGAQGQLVGQVFLDGYPFFEFGIPGEIGDAEAAGAKLVVNAIFAEQMADGQGMEAVGYEQPSVTRYPKGQAGCSK